MMSIMIFYIIVGEVYLFSLTVRRKLVSTSTYCRWGDARNRANITGR